LKKFSAFGGLALAIWLIWRLGPGEVWAQLSGGSWVAFGGVVGAFLLQQALGTLALWLLGTEPRRPGWRATRFWRLARVRYVGEVLNYAMPTGALGGEPYKYLMLRRSEGKGCAFQALAAAKFLHLAGAGPFAFVAFLAAAAGGLGGERWFAPLVFLGLLSLAVSAAVWSLLLWRGVGRSLVGGYYRIRRRVPRRLRKVRRLLHVDRAAAGHIRGAWGRAIIAYGLYIGTWWAAALEWFAAAKVLGIAWPGPGMTGAGLFQCVTLLVGAIPVPAGVGTQETGKMALATVLGLAPQAGVAISLVRRAREMLMVLSALILGLAEARRGTRPRPAGLND
jgi:hypothetical protein